MQDAYVYDGLRTPIGRHAGGLAPGRPVDLLGGVIKALVGRNPFKLGDYEDAVVGCTNQAGEDARNVARHAALLAGLPIETGGITVNRLCGSGPFHMPWDAGAVPWFARELVVACVS